MINHNIDEPKQRGYWYDSIVTGKKETRTMKELFCTVHFGYVSMLLFVLSALLFVMC